MSASQHAQRHLSIQAPRSACRSHATGGQIVSPPARSDPMSAQSTPPARDGTARSAARWDVDRLSDMISTHAPDGTYRFVSAAARELLGYEPEELVGTWASDLFHPDDVPKVSGVHRSGSPVPRRGRLPAAAQVRRVRLGRDDDADRRRRRRRGVRDRLLHPPGARADAASAWRQLPRVRGADHRDAAGRGDRPRVPADLSLADGRVIAYEALACFPGDPAHRPDRWFADAWHVDLGIPLELLAVQVEIDALPLLPWTSPCA